MPLRVRLALFGGAVVALALVLFGVLLYALLARGVMTNQDDALRTRARQAVASLDTSGSPPQAAPVVPADLRTTTDVFVEVFETDGTLLYTTVEPAINPDVRPGFVTEGGFRMYSTPFQRGYVVTGQSTKVPQSNLSGIVVFLVVSAVPALIAALIASWLVAGRALAPLQSTAVTAADIGRTRDFARRLAVPRSRDEVAVLASSFNGMLIRLQEAYESQKQFVSDASHELRTPLTTIQGNAGLLASRAVADDVRQAAVTDIVQESSRMSRLVDRLLTLARADGGFLLARTPHDLKTIIDEVCRQAASQHPAMTLDAQTEAASVLGDEDALRQLAWILLDNAFRYARANVGVTLTTESGWARLVVADDGPGVPRDDRDKVFERFYRVEGSRTGPHSGLGLAIARWIAAQHEGRILAGEATLGGAAFLVDLPLLRTS
jgi:two-component system, OmpR family, sensor kinase